MSTGTISVVGVSKFYGEVLGVNRVTVDIKPGLTGLVGPNGSGKSTLMHLLCGLLRPTRGSISILGLPPDRPEELFRVLGYCTQYDSFPNGVTGYGFLTHTLALHGFDRRNADRRANEILERVGLVEAAGRRVAGYSKGMRQRIKLAQAICHDPRVLILDEPLNGLDPMGRAEMIELFKEFARDDRHVIVSSHILHEVDLISDGVIMIHGGSVVAEGSIRDVRGEITAQPLQGLVRCDKPQVVAAKAFELAHVVEAKIVGDNVGVLLRTTDAKSFFTALAKIILTTGIEVETVTPADENVDAVYGYLIGDGGGGP